MAKKRYLFQHYIATQQAAVVDYGYSKRHCICKGDDTCVYHCWRLMSLQIRSLEHEAQKQIHAVVKEHEADKERLHGLELKHNCMSI